MKVTVIDAIVNDNADYEYITDNAMHNTLNELFKWAEESNVNVAFSKEYDKEGYSLRLLVKATFESQDDYALFKLAFEGKPFNKIEINKDMEGRFVHG